MDDQISKGLENLIAALEQEHKKLREMQEQLGTNLAEVGTDCISRQGAIDALRDWEMCYDWDEHCREEPKAPWVVSPSGVINKLPSAQPKKGRWISADATFGREPFYCSECGENTWDTVMGKPRWNFCPNCGADMRGDQDG